MADGRLTDEQRRNILHYLSRRNTVFLAHVDEKQIMPEVNNTFRRFADRNGFRAEIAAVWYDRNRRPVFQALRAAGERGHPLL